MFDSTLLDAALGQLCKDLIEQTEDFASIEQKLHEIVSERSAQALGEAITEFDEELFSSRPSGWRVKEKVQRSPFTRFGQIAYTKRVYESEIGERVHLTDELVALHPLCKPRNSACLILILLPQFWGIRSSKMIQSCA